jgi:hypothetical protein
LKAPTADMMFWCVILWIGTRQHEVSKVVYKQAFSYSKTTQRAFIEVVQSTTQTKKILTEPL